jgi:D-amino-acid oxidase
MTMNVCIVGSGVSGLSSALCLLEAGMDVHILTREMPGETTSAVAGAIWHALSTVGDRRMATWAEETGRRLDELAQDPASGVALLPLQEPIPGRIDERIWQTLLSEWRKIHPDLAPLSASALPAGYSRGVEYTTFLVETPIYMNYLLDRFQQSGGSVEVAEVADLYALTQPDRLVVNCSGAWAGKLANDPHVYPIRGQVVRLRPQPEQRIGYHASDGPMGITYIFPRGQDCILGGTYETGNWSREPDDATSQVIRQTCEALSPSLVGAEVLDVRVGLRPGRDQVRLEREDLPNGSVIHNYGHGGIGFTLSWGCAAEVAMIARQWAATSM